MDRTENAVPLLLFNCCLADHTENTISLLLFAGCYLATATVQLPLSRSPPSNVCTYHSNISYVILTLMGIYSLEILNVSITFVVVMHICMKWLLTDSLWWQGPVLTADPLSHTMALTNICCRPFTSCLVSHQHNDILQVVLMVFNNYMLRILW
jgi:hypothetical protein